MKSPIALIAALASVICLADADEAEDVGTFYLNAYLEFERAEKAEKQGDRDEAIQLYLKSYDRIERIEDAHPDWRSEVVRYRLRKLREALLRLGVDIRKTRVG